MTTKPSRNDVYTAASTLRKRKGAPALKKVLGTYGAVLTGQIKMRDWTRFIADCQKAEAA